MLDLTCPNYQIFIGASDVSKHVTGFSFRHPLAEPSTPLIWTGQIEIDTTIENNLGALFFDDELNPNVWLSGLQPIDVYFNGAYWQRFRIKPSGYRYDQLAGQAAIEITDIIGILDSYAPSADTPEFKTGGNNYWNQLAVSLIQKQASILGTTVAVTTPPYGIGGIFKVPRSVKGSYIKEAQKMAGERGFWMWSDKEVIKWVEYPESTSNIVWQKSRKELLNYTRQQGLDPVKEQITISATHEDVDTCNDVYPRFSFTYTSGAIATFTGVPFANGTVTGLSQGFGGFIQSQTTLDRRIQNDYTYIYFKAKSGMPALETFGGTVEANGRINAQIPEVKGLTNKKVDGSGVIAGVLYEYINQKNKRTFSYNWAAQRNLLLERDETIYENIPIDSQNPSKIVRRTITRCEPYAKYPDGLQYFGVNKWFPNGGLVIVDPELRKAFPELFPYPSNLVFSPSEVTEKVTTTYEYIEIKRDDIIVQTGQRLYEIKRIVENKEQIYFFKRKVGGLEPYTSVTPTLTSGEITITEYTKLCQGRWRERKTTSLNKGQSSVSTGYLFQISPTEQEVTSIPEITYRPAPYPVIQRPLLANVITGYAGISPYVQSKEFANAETLTTKGECERYARYIGRIKWQRYYSRELASGYGTVLGYQPFQSVYAGNGAYIRDRFGVSLNRDGDQWQFVEDCIGNKIGSIPEIAPPLLPFPPVLSTTLNISNVPNQAFIQGIAIAAIAANSAGGQAPYTYSSSALPTGLSFSGGILSGIPSAIGTSTVTLTVTDSLGGSASTSFAISINAPPIPVSIVTETTKINLNVAIATTVTFLGGLPMPIAAKSLINIATKATSTKIVDWGEVDRTYWDKLTTELWDILV